MSNDEVVLNGMWRTIKVIHHAMRTTAPMVEWLYDVAPEEHKLEAAKRLDAFNAMLKSCDELVAPMRKIMEGDK